MKKMSEVFKFKNIMVGVDISEDAQKAFHYAVERARVDDAKLLIVSILETDNMNIYQAMDSNYFKSEREKLTERLMSYRQYALDQGVKAVETYTGEGDVAEVIIKTILPNVTADLLVVGSNDKKGLIGYFGSHAAYIAKNAPISVMVVR